VCDGPCQWEAAGTPRVLCLSYRLHAAGLNLHRANHVVVVRPGDTILVTLRDRSAPVYPPPLTPLHLTLRSTLLGLVSNKTV